MTASSESSKKTLKRSIRVIALAVFVGIGIYGFFLVNRGEPPQPQPNIPQPAAAPDVGEVPDIPFVNIAKEWGVEFVHRNGATGEKLLPESMGGGAAFFDFDKDGDPDLLLVSGQSWPWDDDTNDPRSSSLSLFRNDNDRFVDVTEEAGLAIHYYGQGVAVGDYDSDGDDDVFLTAVGNNLMFRNDGGRFVDVTEKTGLMGNESDWTSSAGFFDYDRDGDLDLFVCNYIQWSREIDKSAGYTLSGIGRAYAPPFNFAGTQCYLYRNDGARFTDVSAQAGVQVLNDSTDDPVGKALAVTFLDFDRDGWDDVFVANDMVKNFLFRNKGDGTFEELGEWYRFAYDSNGGATSAMGIDSAYFRNNNDLAIAIGNFSNEMTSLYVSQDGDGVFTDEAITAGIGGPTRTALSFGLLFDDMDLDSRVDFLQTNGHLEEDINLVQQSQQYRQECNSFGTLAWRVGMISSSLLQDKSATWLRPLWGGD